ncbi:uncharacterized protein LOC125649855 [Ostrea edulis]|uniref:uncharacterized protein LOC125649855 n=1 Tax=Ostrea edulis TaxID=37623 RepID=UPI0024AEFA5A|nr:uncharacterized protein LOC125649855 [Ostrea edulis]
MAHMQQRVVRIISKSPSQRNEAEIQLVLPWLRKKSALFTELDKSVLTDVIRNCAYLKAFKDDVIIVQGEKGNSFFIMLTGKTSVLIDTQKSDDDALPPDDTNQTIDSSIMDRKTEDGDDGADDCKNKQEKNKQSGVTKAVERSKFGKFIIHYEEGKSFGELALMSEDSVRNATVIADEETDLLVISRELFNRSMKAKQEEEYRERRDFIKTCPFFSNWSPKFKKLLEMSLRKEHYYYGSTIVKQGNPPPGLLFIVQGQAKIVMNPTQHSCQYPSILIQKSVPIQNQLNGLNHIKPRGETERDVLQQHVRVRRRDGYVAAEKRHRSMSVELCCVEKHDVIGDIEMALELDTSVNSVICNSNATVMVLDAKNYDRLVAKKNPQTITKICQRALQKLQCRCHTTKGSKIPLLNNLVEKLREKLPKRQINIQLRQQITELDKEKEQLMEQLIDLYLKGKVPMIEPFVPNALYYRNKTIRRAEMMEHRNKLAKGIAQSGKRSLYQVPKRKVARSMKQLKTANAEQELLSPSMSRIRPFSDYGMTVQRNVQQRPRTAIGLTSLASMKERTRPVSENDRVFLTECGDLEGERDNMMITDNDSLFKQLDNIHREKYENRSRIICSATAREELINDMRVFNGKSSEITLPNDDAYFDWETSEGNLIRLEDKIKGFCDKLEKTTNNKDAPKVSHLKRFSIQDDRDENNFELKVPKPGGTVFVRTKVCNSHESPSSDEVHQHVRRFVLTRESSSGDQIQLPDRPKSAFAGSRQRR